MSNVSPTGAPLISQRVLRVLLLAYAVLAAVNGALLGILGADHAATRVLFVVLAGSAPLIGAAGPGLRRPSPPAGEE